MSIILHILFLLTTTGFSSGPVEGLLLTPSSQLKRRTAAILNDDTFCDKDDELSTENLISAASSRRRWLKGILLSSFSISVRALTAGAENTAANVANDDLAPSTPLPLDMQYFIDKEGLFSLRVPAGFYTLRRTYKGDLPDTKTGKGRRGSSIFTAGNMAKAEVIAVERYPTRVLLEENGIVATGDLSTFPGIGDPRAIANLIVQRRERDSTATAQKPKVLDSVDVSSDGKELRFRLRTEIDVQKPELLLEQTGLSQLFRITIAKITLKGNDGNLMAIFASALESDFTNGVDGPALEDSVNSFQVTDQSS